MAEPHAARRKRIDIWCIERSACAMHVAQPDIVGKDQNDIRLFFGQPKLVKPELCQRGRREDNGRLIRFMIFLCVSGM